VDRSMESYIQSYNYLRGLSVSCLSAFTKHLPIGSAAEYIGETPDRFAVMKEKMYVDSTTSNEQAVSFSCKPKFMIKNKILPGRTFSRECQWVDYGTASTASNCRVGPATFAANPTCDRTLDNCVARGNKNRFGGFVSIPQRGITVI
ncbi:unnamed protein product, partial [marine sediment metagenome]